MNVLLLVAILFSHCRSGHTEVDLNPVGKVKVCADHGSMPMRLTCRTDGVLWSISGFEGLPDQLQTRVPALTLVNSSLRMATSDMHAWTNYSIITFSSFRYGDHGATLSCENHFQTGQKSVTFSIAGPPNCSVSLTASRLTGDSLVVRWVIGHCFFAEPTQYWIQWFSIGKPMVSYEWSTFTAYINSDISSYKITGLSSNIKYFIWFGFVAQGICSGTGPLQSVLSETMSTPGNTTVYGLVAVIVVLFFLLLTMTTIFVVVCKKLNTVTKTKIGRGSGGQEQHLKDKSADKGMNQTPDDDYTLMDMNPAYQST